MKANFTNHCNPQPEQRNNASTKGKWKYLNPFFFSLLLAMLFGNAAFAQFIQPSNCKNVQCTSNDVRVVKPYITGANGKAIDCDATAPFAGAQLHLPVTSNTQRIGVSISGTLNIGGDAKDFGYCFSGVTLKNNGVNDLAYDLPSDMVALLSCAKTYSITNLFITWGTGNDDFCSSSSNAKCPATPAKCRFVPGETIPVDVKLVVFFDYNAGSCDQDGKREITFTPTVDEALNVSAPLTFKWYFDPSDPTDLTSTTPDVTKTDITLLTVADAGTSAKFSPGEHTVVLVVTDNSTVKVTKQITRTITVESCCNLTAPQLGPYTFCQSQGKTFGDLPQTDGNSGAYNWFDKDDNGLVSTDLIPVGTHTYYVSLSKDNCESERSEVTVTVQTAPNAGTSGPLTVCAGTTPSEAQLFAVIGAHDDGGSWTQNGNVYTYTVAGTSPCTDATASVTVTEQAKPNAGTSGPLTVCAGTTPSEAQLFAVIGAHDDGGSWTQNGNVYTYTVAATAPCTEAATSNVTVSFDLASAVTTSLSGNSIACSGNNSGTINIVSKTGMVVRWESAPDNNGAPGTWTEIKNDNGSSITAASYSFSNLTATTWYRVVVQSGVCTEASSTPIKITVNVCTITYTQGYYGNANGSGCNGTSTVKTTKQLLSDQFNKYGSLTIGNQSGANNVVIPNSAAGVDKLIAIMPGGSTANKLQAGSFDITINTKGCKDCFDAKYLSSGKINNVLLSQTIALALNLRNSPSLGSITFVTGKYGLSTAPTTGCPQLSIQNATSSCYPVSKAVADYLISINKGTIQGLLELANSILGGATLPKGISYSNVNATVDAINRGFDQGRMFLGFTNCGSLSIVQQAVNAADNFNVTISQLAVSAYPNPFTDHIRFTIQAPKAGRATLEVYNMLGQKVGVPFEGQLNANEARNVEYTAPVNSRTNLIYMLRMNGEQVSGKLMSTKQ